MKNGSCRWRSGDLRECRDGKYSDHVEYWERPIGGREEGIGAGGVEWGTDRLSVWGISCTEVNLIWIRISAGIVHLEFGARYVDDKRTIDYPSFLQRPPCHWTLRPSIIPSPTSTSQTLTSTIPLTSRIQWTARTTHPTPSSQNPPPPPRSILSATAQTRPLLPLWATVSITCTLILPFQTPFLLSTALMEIHTKWWAVERFRLWRPQILSAISIILLPFLPPLLARTIRPMLLVISQSDACLPMAILTSTMMIIPSATWTAGFLLVLPQCSISTTVSVASPQTVIITLPVLRPMFPTTMVLNLCGE